MTRPSVSAQAMAPRLGERIRAALAQRLDGDVPRLDDGDGAIRFDTLIDRFGVAAEPDAVAGGNVLIKTRRALSAAIALASLDGMAARMVLWPPDLSDDQLPYILETAQIDAIVHDPPAPTGLPEGAVAYGLVGDAGRARQSPPRAGRATEWVMFTSGTTGAPKMVVHSLEGLTGAFSSAPRPQDERIVWATFYDIRRYGGLQMLLRALTGGHTMILTSPHESTGAFLDRLAAAEVTHVSGTPSHWRSALMNPALAG